MSDRDPASERRRTTSNEIDRPRPQLGLWLVVALLLHGAFAAGVGPKLFGPRPLELPDSRRFMGLVSPEAIARARDNQKRRRADEARKPTPNPAATAKADKPEPEQKNLTGQVVEIPPSADRRPPEDARYLSEHNSRVERETRSRHQTQDYQNAMNEVTSSEAGPTQAPTTPPTAISLGDPQQGQNSAAPASVAQEAAFEIPTVEKRQKVALDEGSGPGVAAKEAGSDEVRGNSNRLRLSLGDAAASPGQQPAQAPAQGPTLEQLLPSVGVLSRVTGAPANDFLEDVEEGEGTFLNSREFKYASFFGRVKRSINQHWRPTNELYRRDPTGNVYGRRSRNTTVTVILNADGSLKDLEVARSSGVEFLDREALDAFRRAEPFPNPPHGLIDTGSGTITFAFGFIVEFRSGGLDLPY